MRPYIWLILSLPVVFGIYGLATSFPDQHPLTFRELLKDSDGGLAVLIFGLMLGPALMIREGEDGTLSFLDGLPLSRTRIFAAKAIAGLLVLLLVPLTDLLETIVFGLISRTSIDAPLPWRFLGVFGTLHVFAAVYALAISLAAAFLRQWLILISGLVLWTYASLSAQGETWHQWLNPLMLFSRMRPPSGGVSWQHVTIQGGVAIAFVLLAWFLFRSMGARAQESLDQVRGRRFGRVMLSAARLGAPVVWFLAVSTAVRNTESSAPKSNGRPLGETAFARYETAYYEFLFLESQREWAKELFLAADDVFLEVTTYLESPRPERLVVDLASPIPSHAAAVTNWTKIRYPIFQATPLDKLARTLAHETVHVLAHQVAGTGFTSAYNSTRFFNEGLAQYLENEFYDDEEAKKRNRQLTAAVASRGRVPLETLLDNTALAETRDPDLVYPLGEVFCRALVEVAGKDAPLRVLQEFQHSNLGYRLEGIALWRAMLQECGMDLEAVTAAYDTEIERLVETEAQFIASVPRLSAKVEVKDDKIWITPQYTGKAPGKLVCTLERSVVLGNKQERYKAEPDGVIRIPRDNVAGGSFRYLLGWDIEGFPWPSIFEPWAEAQL